MRRHGAAGAVLDLPEEDGAAVEVYVIPGQANELALAHSGLQCPPDHRAEPVAQDAGSLLGALLERRLLGQVTLQGLFQGGALSLNAAGLKAAGIDVRLDLPRPGFGACLGLESVGGGNALAAYLRLSLSVAFGGKWLRLIGLKFRGLASP